MIDERLMPSHIKYNTALDSAITAMNLITNIKSKGKAGSALHKLAIYLVLFYFFQQNST